MTTNVERLEQKLKDMDVRQFSVFPGPGWDALSVEERAAAVLEVIEAHERGEGIDVTDAPCGDRPTPVIGVVTDD